MPDHREHVHSSPAPKNNPPVAFRREMPAATAGRSGAAPVHASVNVQLDEFLPGPAVEPRAPVAVRDFRLGLVGQQGPVRITSFDLTDWAAKASAEKVSNFMNAWRSWLEDSTFGSPAGIFENEGMRRHLSMARLRGLEVMGYTLPSASKFDEAQQWILDTRPDYKAIWQRENLAGLLRRISVLGPESAAEPLTQDRFGLPDRDLLAFLAERESMEGSAGA